jgi:hypothetical protein
MTATKITQELLDQIYAQAKEGVGWGEIASNAHIQYSTIQRYLSEAGFKPQRAGNARTSERLRKQITDLAVQGVSETETARILGLSRDTVKKYRRLAGFAPLGHGDPGYKAMKVPRCRRCEILLTDDMQGYDGLCKYCLVELEEADDH